ncbi:hypothetical protein [Agrobacterium vaccinii]|uniref:hypothetical protein n=1 Tax=Agrobacterium vaccinii TaxID=2735528 RepID=UPI001E3F556D|nr:hypothetical protein [Agrobacterium vaccinii]UHS57510.1 hypothetical protein HRS00_12160 [Agrobacterium vaccinii]
MSVVSHRSVKQYAFKFSAIASASLGIVLGLAVFDASLPLLSYGKFWLLITACLCAAFIAGLMTDCLLARLIKAPIFSRIRVVSKQVRSPVERRFKGNRTDEEYRRIKIAIVVPLAIVCLIGMLFVSGEWTARAFTIGLFLWIAKGIFNFFDASTGSSLEGVIGWTLSGFFLALLFGFFS